MKKTGTIFLKRILVILLSTIIFVACKKTDSGGDGPNPTAPDLVTKVNAPVVSGFVTDENNLPVINAPVQIGTSAVTTDKYGYFEARNVAVLKNAATVTVTRTGYFKGIKSFIATEGKSAFFRIKLIPKTIAGTVNAATGGTVVLANGMSVSLPGNSLINAATGALYTGAVNVAAYWIDPTSNEMYNIMPGDLRGINTNGNLQLLTTFGMTAVELSGTSGELLKIASGKKASLSLPIPSSILSAAPSTIPLWYFDEVYGLWKQEGSATKNAGNYIGDVTHFSFWNVDGATNYVQFSCTILNSTGAPIQNAFVKVSAVSNPQNAGFGFTDSTGFVSGVVPDNSQLNLEIYSDVLCTTTTYSQTFNTSNTNLSLGNIVVSNTNSIATVTGNITTCTNSPVTNGYILINTDGTYRRYPLSNTGSFSLNMLLCGNTANTVTLIAEDINNLQQSAPLTYTVNPGSNVVTGLQACGNTIDEFFNYTIDGINYSIPPPPAGYNSYYDNPAGTIEIYGLDHNNQNVWAKVIFFNSNIGVGTNQGLSHFSSQQCGSSSTFFNTSNGANITEFGAVGQYISGNFSCQILMYPGTLTHDVSGNFRIKRD